MERVFPLQLTQTENAFVACPEVCPYVILELVKLTITNHQLTDNVPQKLCCAVMRRHKHTIDFISLRATCVCVSAHVGKCISPLSPCVPAQAQNSIRPHAPTPARNPVNMCAPAHAQNYIGPRATAPARNSVSPRAPAHAH